MELNDDELTELFNKFSPLIKSNASKWNDQVLFTCLAHYNIWDQLKKLDDPKFINTYTFNAVVYTHSIMSRELLINLDKHYDPHYRKLIKQEEPENLAENKENADILESKIKNAIDTLSSNQREVINLFKGGMKIKDIAKKLNNHPKNISQIYRIARRQLIVALEEMGVDLDRYKREAEREVETND